MFFLRVALGGSRLPRSVQRCCWRWPGRRFAADPQADNAALRGYLDAGEFGPAMELARAPRRRSSVTPGRANRGGASRPRRPPIVVGLGRRDRQRSGAGRHAFAGGGRAAGRRGGGRAGRFRLADRPDYIHDPAHFLGGRGRPRLDPALPHRRDHRSARGASSAVKERIRRAAGGPA